LKHLLQEYRIELAALLIMLLLVLLWGTWEDVSAALLGYKSSLAPNLVDWLKNRLTKIAEVFSSFSLADLLFWLLILAALVFVAWRLRRRFLISAAWQTYHCPRCGGDLHRLHRSTLDRLLSRSLLPDARRFGCANPDCGWSGLRRRRVDDPHRRRRSLSEDHN
jgi:hypothetical protein